MQIHFLPIAYRGVPHMIQIEVSETSAVPHRIRLFRQRGRGTPCFQPVGDSAFRIAYGKILFQDGAENMPWKNTKLMVTVTDEIIKKMVSQPAAA